MLPLPRLLWILLLIGALLRVGAIELRPARAMESSPDESQYLDIAHSLMHGQGFRLNGEPTAYRDPLYPILAAMVMWPFAGSSRPVLYLQVLLSCATAFLFYRIGCRRFGSAAALLLAGIWLFYPGAI